MNIINDRDAESVALRLLCEKAQERLERAWSAAEYTHRAVPLPDGTYIWVKENSDGSA